METIIAVTIAVFGWLTNHFLTLRAQRKSFMDHLINNARIEICNGIRDYIDWLNKLVQHNATISLIIDFPGQIDKLEKPYKFYIIEIRKTLKEVFLDPRFITLLSEYETLFPETKQINSYIHRKHIALYINIESAIMFENENEIDKNNFLKAIKKLDFNLVGAQQAAVRDLLIVLQNLTLGKIKKYKKEFSAYPMTKHPRILLDKNRNIKIVQYGEKDYPINAELDKLLENK
ncbi:MAG: hypothetical protein IPM56_11785 [Ignavibacteriales bacterium]|nr:MAG: hypothetical protein IPM56_11785 [Ignavibacteriales bacterium]